MFFLSIYYGEFEILLKKETVVNKGNPVVGNGKLR